MSRSAELVCVDPDRVWAIWPAVADQVRSAIERGRLTRFSIVEDDVLSGRSLLWLVWAGNSVLCSVVTELRESAELKSCVIVACAGELPENWRALLERLEDFARSENCSAMRLRGRQGWARLLRDYRRGPDELRKELN